MEKSEKKIMELVKSESRKADGDLRVIHGYEQLFGVAVVYAYGTLKEYERVSRLLFAEPEEMSPSPGISGFATGVDSIGKMVAMVWITSEESKFEYSLPLFVHGIVLTTREILDWAGVRDFRGEVQAHFVERETERVLREMFGMPLPQPSVQASKAIEAIIKEKFGLAKEEKQQ